MSHNIESDIINAQGLKLFVQVDTAENPRAWMMIMHGLDDHSGRYDHVAEFFNQHEISVLRFDMQGHGQSQGTRSYVQRFEHYVDEFTVVVNYFLKESGAHPRFLLAHSLGGLVSAHYFIQLENPFDGVIFSSGLFKVNEDISPILQKVSGVISVLAPKLPTVKLDLAALSRDQEVVERARADPLHYKGGVRARTGAEIIKATEWVQDRLQELDFPMLILHGTADQLTKDIASKLLFSLSGSQDKRLELYEGAFHELLNETNRLTIMQEILGWIEERMLPERTG